MTAPESHLTTVCFLSRMARPGLGDLLQRNIFLNLLRKAYPQAKITWVLGDHVRRMPLGREMAESHSYADTILYCPDVDDDPLGEDGQRSPGVGWPEFRNQLADAAFDVAVIDPRSVRLGAAEASAAGIPVRIAVRTGSPDDALITDPILLTGPSDLHAYAVALGDAIGLAEIPPPEAIVPALPMPGPARAVPPEWTTHGPLVGVHPACSPGWHRRWPLERFSDVAQRAAAGGATVVVFGGTGDLLEADLLTRAVRASVPEAEIHQVLGWSFADTAAVMSTLTILVGNDSGPAHLAAALHVPSVVTYGPDGEQAMWQRVYSEHTGLDKHFPCQQRDNDDWDADTQCAAGCPCEYVSPDGEYPRCLTAIGVDEVWAVVAERLRR